jgi:hypothetical protein
MQKIADAQALADLLVTHVLHDDPPVLLHDRLATLLVALEMYGDLAEAAEYAEPLLPQIQNTLEASRRRAEKAGTSWQIELFGSENEYVRGSAFADGSLPAQTQIVRRNRKSLARVHDALVGLSAPEFELACTTILRTLGSKEPFTSPLRDDGGIDFYGRLELKGRLDTIHPYGGFDGQTGMWLIGQAKHYQKQPVQTAHLRELVGSIELARTGGAIHQWEGLNLRPFDATLHLIFTTGVFASGARQLLQRTGMLSMDGMQLATFLCDVGMGFAAEGGSFDEGKFKSALTSTVPVTV